MNVSDIYEEFPRQEHAFRFIAAKGDADIHTFAIEHAPDEGCGTLNFVSQAILIF